MRKTLVLVLVMGFLAVGVAFGEGYRGTYITKSGGVTLTLVLNQDASGRITGTLSSTEGTRFGLEGAIQEGIASGTCTGDAGQSFFEAEFEGDKLVFTRVEVNANGEGASRSIEFVRAATGGEKKAPPAPTPSAGAASKPPSSPDAVATPPPAAAQTATGLMRYFAGDYYSYSSGSTMYGSAGTERTVTLCPDGRYRDSYEFSASGTGEPAWGGVNSQKGAARWTIQGDQTRGVIIVTYAGGQTKRIPFQVVSKDEGAILFDGIKFAYAGAPKCQ
jgi:hypothetical protein